MSNITDRGTGAFFMVFGALLYFAIIPAQVDDGGESWVLPTTIPNAVSITMALCGALLMLRPTNQRGQNTTDLMFAIMYIVLLSVGLFVMSYVGFIYTVPFIALIIMFLIGERRPFWLGIGVIGLPVIIWVLVVQVLERSLP